MTSIQQVTITADVKPFCFKWTIENYLRRGKGERVIRSDPFTISGFESTQWELELHPKGRKDDGFVSLFLSCHSDTYFQFLFKVSFTIKSANNNEDYTKGLADRISTFHGYMGIWGYAKFIEIKVLEERVSDLLPNGSLTLICTGDVILDMDWKDTPGVVSGTGLLEDAKAMLESHVGKDVTLVAIDGSELPVHKFILCARSPVFAAMFEHDTEEKKTGRVVIKDFKADALKGLISFMYTDEAPEDVKELAMDLLMASHKYQIPRLLDLMVKHVSKILSVANVLNILSHAILLDLSTLKNACLQFIKSNTDEVRESQPWKKCADVDVFKVVSEFWMK